MEMSCEYYALRWGVALSDPVRWDGPVVCSARQNTSRRPPCPQSRLLWRWSRRSRPSRTWALGPRAASSASSWPTGRTAGSSRPPETTYPGSEGAGEAEPNKNKKVTKYWIWGTEEWIYLQIWLHSRDVELTEAKWKHLEKLLMSNLHISMTTDLHNADSGCINGGGSIKMVKVIDSHCYNLE